MQSMHQHSPPPMPGSYEDLHQQAMEHVEQLEYEEALAIFQRIYTRLGKNSQKLFKRRPSLEELYAVSIAMSADLLNKLERYDEAISHYHWLAEVMPEDVIRSRRAVARIKIDQGQVDEGLDELRALAATHTDTPRLWLSLGLELMGQKQYEEAEASLKRIAEHADVDAEDRSLAYSYLSDLYREKKRYNEAITAWQTAMDLNENEDDIETSITTLYQIAIEQEDYEAAQSWLAQEPNVFRQGFYRGLVAHLQGDDEQAEKLWQATAKRHLDHHAPGFESWAEAALRVNHDLDDIIHHASHAIENEIMNLRGMIMLAITQARAGYPDAMHAALTAGLSILKNSRPPTYELGDEYWQIFDELVASQVLKAEAKSYFFASEADPESETEADVNPDAPQAENDADNSDEAATKAAPADAE